MSVGGYFELELNNAHSNLHQGAIKLNTGRNCLEYILKIKKYSKLYIPYYTCEVILEPLQKTNTEYDFYHINEALEPIIDFQIRDNEALLYTNYFGLKDKFIGALSETAKNVIVDNSQALFASPNKNYDTFYSPRKYVGIPDGGLLFTNEPLNITLQKDLSYFRVGHLVKRIDESADSGYNDFKANDRDLSHQDVKSMSNLTQRLLASINFEEIKNKRIENFTFLHQNLKNLNKMFIPEYTFSCPMVYPFLADIPNLRERLLDKRIYIAQYWPNVLNWCSSYQLEHYLCTNIFPLPIDQRYGIEDMKKVLSIVLEN
jgi:hypothetical protein